MFKKEHSYAEYPVHENQHYESRHYVNPYQENFHDEHNQHF